MLPSRGRGFGGRQSPEPAMYRHRPTSELTQDISHLLTSVFKNMYTSEVLGVDTVENMIKSRGGDNSHHEQFVEELQKVRAEYNNRLTEADMLERHIIQARARATAEEERILNLYKEEVPDDYRHVALPPVKSTFRWCVDNELLKKHDLISPQDYILDPPLITRAPKGNISKVCVIILKIMKEPFTKLYMKIGFSFLHVYWQKKSRSLRKSVWKNDMSRTERQKDRAFLQRLEDRHNFLKNPRFFPPNSLHGGRSLILPQKKIKRMIAGVKKTVMTLELQNMTSTSQRVRVIPPTTSAFSIGFGKFPDERGLVAPGMSCHYVIQFIPEYLADYDDYILVESQATYPLLVPLQGRRPPPILTLPQVLDCGACLVGGVKFTEFECKNEGESVGKFCIMPKKMWPPPHFRAVATYGYVEQAPFGIRPAVFELPPGHSTLVEVSLFMPIFPEVLSVTYIIVCDNCQVKEITVTGLGQLIALKLLSVTGGESCPMPGEFTDVTAQHLVRFTSLNPESVAEKTLVLRNITHVELPFFWQIMKPNLQPLMLEGKVDFRKIKYVLETEPAFSITPAMGTLSPHSDHSFTLTFFPKKLKEYHSVLQIVLQNIPELPCPSKPEQYEIAESKEEDVIALEIDIKGRAEPFQLILEPYAIIIPGEHYIGVNVRRTFKMYNNSKSPVTFSWEKISECDIVEVEPCTGKLAANECCKFEFIITGGKPGHSCQDVHCQITHSAEPVVLHVEADFKGPELSIDVPSLDLGLIKLGQKVLCTFEIANLSQLPGKWKIQESPACLAKRDEEASPFTVLPPSGELHPLGKCSVSVLFTSYMCQRLQTVLEMEVENGVGSHIPVFVEVQTPHVCLLSSHLHFDLSIGIPAEATVQLFNQTLLPTRFKWGEVSAHSSGYSWLDKLSDLALCCSIEDMLEPLFLAISGEVKGLTTIYHLLLFLCSDEEKSETSQELKLDFGSEVPLKNVIKRQLIITNHSELAALFTISVNYFSSCSSPSDKDLALEKTGRITRQIVKRKQSAFRAAMLAHGKGAAFHVHPSEGTLKAFQELIVEITAYNNMWGHYQDHLACTVGGAFASALMNVPARSLSSLRIFSNSDRGFAFSLLLNSDIRMDWESYNQDKDDDKLVDLLVFYGEPFPIKEPDSNEIEVLWEAETLLEKTSCASDSSPEEISDGAFSQSPTSRKIISVVIRPHEGVPSDYPFCITPKQVVVPAGGAAAIHISFTPLMLPEIINKFECEGFALGFMSLDSEVVREIPGKVTRRDGYAIAPLRIDLQAFVKVSFHTTLELLTYQHFPEDRLPPGFQVLQLENGDKILEFRQDLVIEYANKATQVLPMTAFLTVPVLELSRETIDFKTCLVNETKTETVFVMNTSGCRSYWAALLEPEVFSISPNNGILEAHKCSTPTKAPLLLRFTPREDVDYETVVTVVGMLGEQPCLLCVRGRGSYDEKYEEKLKS
uniref:DLEC1 cilia and flagella associated protein n=1 Tax=Varanus komodoensis TaxID=61221 RepID=A0A8D2LHT7_VARKO